MPKYAEEILAAVTELQRHPTADIYFVLHMEVGHILLYIVINNFRIKTH